MEDLTIMRVQMLLFSLSLITMAALNACNVTPGTTPASVVPENYAHSRTENRTQYIAPSLHPNSANTIVQPQPNAAIVLPANPVTLQHDFLQGDTRNISFNQAAVFHGYDFPASTPYGIIDKKVPKGPLLIFPKKAGMVIIKTVTPQDYRYLPVSSESVPLEDEQSLLSAPGWGLATTFLPDRTPFVIQNIRVSAAAFYTTGVLADYDKKHVRVRIISSDGDILWSQDYKWSYFRIKPSPITFIPIAEERVIPVDNLTVDGEFTVEFQSLGNQYEEGGLAEDAGSYDYFAIDYERISGCKNMVTNSFISENGKRAAPWVRLYDQYGEPVCFNLCIRVDGLQ